MQRCYISKRAISLGKMDFLIGLKMYLLALYLVGEGFGASHWFNDKYSHRPLAMTADVENKFAFTTSQSAFEALLDPILISRPPGTENNTKVRMFIIDQLKNLDWTVETDAFTAKTPAGEIAFENVIATLNPETPRRLVMACHFDTSLKLGSNFVGATDSAVPCAMLLEWATTLRKQLDAHKNSPEVNVTLQFIFFDGEEAIESWRPTDSIYGARHLAAEWLKTPYPGDNDLYKTDALHRMDMLVLLDLIGAKSPRFPNYFASTSHWHHELVRIEKALKKAGVWSGDAGEKDFFVPKLVRTGIEDDHLPFLTRNVDILHLICDPFPPVWHTPKDDKSALDFPTIDNLNRIFRVFLARYLHLNP